MNTYVKGTLNISAKALARLNELGVTPPLNRYPNGGRYDSFYLPNPESWRFFDWEQGNQAVANRLTLKGEKQ